MKQLGLAYTQYEQDYDELVPCGHNIWGWGVGWAGQLYPYVKSAGVFLCPSDTGQNAAGNADVVSYGVNSNLVGYWYNGSTSTGAFPASIALMGSPSLTINLFEVRNCAWNGSIVAQEVNGWALNSPAGQGLDPSCDLNGANNPGCNGSIPVCLITSLLYNTGVLGNSGVSTSPAVGVNSWHYNSTLGLHNGGANYLMTDNHAKWLMPSKVCAGFDQVNGANQPSAVATCAGSVGNAAITTTCLGSSPYTATFALH